MPALPSPGESWGIEVPGNVGDCECCGGAVVLEAGARSDGDTFWEGDRGHCAACGTAHQIEIDTDDIDDRYIATLGRTGPFTLPDEACPSCGFWLLDHNKDGAVAVAELAKYRKSLGVHMFAGVIPASLTVKPWLGSFLILSLPCEVLARRRRERPWGTKKAGQIGGERP